MNQYVYLNKFLLQILGVYYFGVKFNDTFKMILCVISVGTFYTSGIVDLINIRNDFGLFAENLGMLLFGFTGLVKYYTLIYSRDKMKYLRDVIKSDKISGEELKNDYHFINHYHEIGLKYCKTYGWILFAASLGVLLQTLPDMILGHGLQLPFPAIYPFSLNSTAMFTAAYIHQITGCYIFVLVYMTFDSWFIFLIHHACGNFCLLQDLLEKLSDVDQQPFQMHERIVKCVKLHQKIYKFSVDIEDVFNIPNLIQFLVSSVAICVSGYEVVIMGFDKPRLLVKHLSSIYLQVAQLLIFNWCGQLIEEKSFGVSHAISRSNLYKLKVDHQRDLSLILLRAQKPSYVTAGKFSKLSLQNFANLMKTSMSYFTMLTSVQEN